MKWKTKHSIFTFFIVALMFTTYVVHRLNVLPDKYMYLLVALGFIFVGLGLYIVRKSKKGTGFNIVCGIISVCLIVGSGYILHLRNKASDIIDAEYNKHEVSIVVKQDSSYQSIQDVADKAIGANSKFSPEIFEKSISLFKQKDNVDIKYTEYDSYENMIQLLETGKLDAIMLNEAQRGLFETIQADFNETTRVIASVNYDERIEEVAIDTSKDSFSILISGIDTYGAITTGSLSDVNMIVTVNTQTHQIHLTSIPRDYHVTLASFNAKDKLTHAGIYGVEESKKTIENLFGINIDYYLKVNFSTMEKVVDTLGGINVYSTYSFTAGAYQFKQGMNYMDGKQALRFVRERKNLPHSDVDRVKNQQAALVGIMNKVMSPSILTKFDSLLNAMDGMFQTNMNYELLSDLVKQQIDTMPKWNFTRYTVVGVNNFSRTTYSLPGPSLFVMEPDYETVKKATNYIKQVENGEAPNID